MIPTFQHSVFWFMILRSIQCNSYSKRCKVPNQFLSFTDVYHLTYTRAAGILMLYERYNPMSRLIPTPTIGEILQEEYMTPLGISAYKLAQSIHVPVSRIQDILHGRRKVTADTSLRLGIFFGVSEDFFLELQNDIDIREKKLSLAEDLKTIQPYKNNK